MSANEPLLPKRRIRWRWTAVLMSMLSMVAVAVWLVWPDRTLPAGVSHEDYEAAELRYQQLYGQSPHRLDVLSLLAEIAVSSGRLETAVACFREIPTEHPRYGLSARLQEGQVLARLGQAVAAERSVREFLSRAWKDPSIPPDQIVAAGKWLSFLLSAELRFEERKVFLADLHERGLADVNDSKQLYFPYLLLWHTSTGSEPVAKYCQHDPSNPMLRIALARYRTFEGRLDEARSLLEALRQEHPENLHCAAALLECYFEASDRENFCRVAKLLPKYAGDEPWLLTWMRGEYAVYEQRWPDAVRFFELVLKQDPTNPSCHMGLGRALAALQRSAEREQVLHRSLVLSRIRAHLHNVTETDADASLKLASECDAIGLAEAAQVFRRHAARIAKANPETRKHPES